MLNRRLVLVLAIFGLSLTAGPAFAADSGSIFGGIDSLLTTINTALSGTTGRGIATVALIVIGIACLSGRMSWLTGLVWCIGLAIVVGAGQIVNSI